MILIIDLSSLSSHSAFNGLYSHPYHYFSFGFIQNDLKVDSFLLANS